MGLGVKELQLGLSWGLCLSKWVMGMAVGDAELPEHCGPQFPATH